MSDDEPDADELQKRALPENAPGVDPVLAARVAALRKLSNQDAVPMILDVVQLCAAGAELSIPRTPAAFPGALALKQLVPKRPLKLRLLPCEDLSLRVPEASAVFVATVAAQPGAMWRGKVIVELNCGAGFSGLACAVLGARAVLLDEEHLAPLVIGSIGVNATFLQEHRGSACFCPLRKNAPPRAWGEGTRAAIASASVCIMMEPFKDDESERRFLTMARELLGQGCSPVCPKLEHVIVAHKHDPRTCIQAYMAPVEGARPTITLAEEGQRCAFRRTLEESGFDVAPWGLPVPVDYFHPFVECWKISLRPLE